MTEPSSRRVPSWCLRLSLRALGLAATLSAAACFPNPDELKMSGATPTGGTIAANGGAGGGGGSGGSPTDGPMLMTDGPVNPGTDAAVPRDGVVIPDVAGDNCADLAAVWCARARECEPRTNAFMTAGLDCPGRLTAWCKTFLADPKDTNWTPDAFKTCTNGLANISCTDWRSSNEYLKGQACLISGKRQNGQGCASWSQCASVRCENFGECGICRPRSNTEGNCQSDVDCSFGLMCSDTGKCKVPLQLGGRCSDENPCHPIFRCSEAGVCAPLGKMGAPCQLHADCDRESFLLCNSISRKCSPARPAPMWKNNNPDGTVSYCADGGTAVGNMGACAPRVKDGEVGCVISGDGGRCIFPALCSIPPTEDVGTCGVPVYLECPAIRPDPPPGGYKPGEDPWCPTTDYPTFCPVNNDVGPNCWDGRTICSTTVRCANEFHACDNAANAYDCQLEKCGPTCTLPAGATVCDRCLAVKCCGSKTLCDADPTCVAKSGPNWTTYDACRKDFCAGACP